jgi:ornithine decarboxylase
VESFESVCDYLKHSQPVNPVLCHRPHAAARSARWFVESFPGDVLYAVKANPTPLILDSLYQAGIRHFDIASLHELALVKRFGDARLYCMNTVKHRQHIREMYFEHGVRDFALDCTDELEKILAATNNAKDLSLHVRITVDNSSSCLPLDRKFGANPAEAEELLVRTRMAASQFGVCFHVGSQSMSPQPYARAIDQVNQLISNAGVILDSLDVGGGFPAPYPGLIPEPLDNYMRVIADAFDNSLTSETCRLKCEPGRALVAESASMLVNVLLRKQDWLYLNDGAYGSLFDAAHVDFPFPVRAIRNGLVIDEEYDQEFAFYGPTCDSIDAIVRPYMLPADMKAGDYIEFGQLGAYGDTMRTNFNGFGHRDEIIVTDEPMLSLFTPEPEIVTGNTTSALTRN